MTGSSVLNVPPCAVESSHMSIQCSSRFRERSRHTSGAWRWAAAAGHEEITPVSVGGRVPVRAWSTRSVVLLLFSFSFLSLFLSAHSQVLDEFAFNRTALNQQIYFQAFDALVAYNVSKIKTGTIYNASLPSNYTNTSVQLESIQFVRLRTGSLRRRGIIVNEIILPIGSTVSRTLRSVVLVYRRFKQYGYYVSTNGTVFVAPVVGIMVYSYNDLANYTTNYGAELTITAAGPTPIRVQLQPSRNIASNELTCISYNNTVRGTDTGVVTNVTGSSLCNYSVLGDYSLLGPPQHHKSNTWKIVVGSVVGGLGAIVILILAAIGIVWYVKKHRFAGMEQKSDQGEPLHQTWFGASRAPLAAGTRTKPILENENV